MENWFIPYQTEALLPARRVLVLAPHPDDEIFGCGGALAIYRAQGADIQVVVLTDGTALADAQDKTTTARTRADETQAALQVLDIGPAQFWACPDRGLADDPSWLERLRPELATADVVLAPSPTEIHPDHAALGRGVLRELQAWADQRRAVPTVMFYEVGVPLQPNFLLDISAVWDLKSRAMACFASQLAQQDYARQIEGLNAFRTYTLPPKVQYAEAFFVLRPEQLSPRQDPRPVPGQLDVREPWALEAVLDAMDAQMVGLQQRLSAQDQVLRARDKDIGDLQQGLAEAEQRLAMAQRAHDQGLALAQRAHDQGLALAQRARDQVQQELSVQTQAHQALLNSHSWRLTRPLRWLGRWLRGGD